LPGLAAMNEKASRLQAYQRNIERYEKLLKPKLNATELRFVEQRCLKNGLPWQCCNL
jgi:hypothetical protein